MKVNDAIALICEQLAVSERQHPTLPDKYAGYAVIKEQHEQLWDEIKRKEQAPRVLRLEASHVAATALRFLIDLC